MKKTPLDSSSILHTSSFRSGSAAVAPDTHGVEPAGLLDEVAVAHHQARQGVAGQPADGAAQVVTAAHLQDQRTEAAALRLFVQHHRRQSPLLPRGKIALWQVTD